MLVTMHHTQVECNYSVDQLVSLASLKPGKYNLEESDQLVLLNAVDIKNRDTNTTLDIFSVDTDVFVLLTGNFSFLEKE